MIKSKNCGPWPTSLWAGHALNYSTASKLKAIEGLSTTKSLNDVLWISLFFCTLTVFFETCEFSRQFLQGYRKDWATAPSALSFWTITIKMLILEDIGIHLLNLINGGYRFKFTPTKRKLNFQLQKPCSNPPYRESTRWPQFSLTQSLTFFERPSLEQRKLCDSSVASYKYCFVVVLLL